MSQSSNNFSFATKIIRDEQRFVGLVDSVKNENNFLFAKNKDLAYFQNKKNVLRPMPHYSDSHTEGLTTKPVFPLAMTFSPKLDQMPGISPHGVTRIRTEENDREKETSFSDLLIRASLTTDKPQIKYNAQRIELPAMLYRGIKYYSNAGTIESPHTTPFSARDRYNGNNQINPGTPYEEQIEKFKTLLRKHPEPCIPPQRFSSHRKIRPKSQQPLLNPLILDFKMNYLEEIENKSTREYESPESKAGRSPNSGFLSEGKAWPPKPDQNIFPTRPIIKKSEKSQNTVEITELPRRTRVVTPQKVVRERSSTQAGNRGKSENYNREVNYRPQSHGNYYGRSNIYREIKSENNPRSFNKYNSISRGSNSPINHEPQQSVKPFDASSNQGSPMETFSSKSPKKIPFITGVVKNSHLQPNDLAQKGSIEETTEFDEAKLSQLSIVRAKIQSRSSKRIRVKPTFGFLETVKLDINNENNSTPNGNINEKEKKATELRTPKFQAENSDAARALEPNPIIRGPGQLPAGNLKGCSGKEGYQFPLPYFRGNKYKPNRAQIPPPNYGIDQFLM